MGLGLVNPRVWLIIGGALLLAFAWGRLRRRFRAWRARRAAKRARRR